MTPGTHLRADRGWYWHHGIDMGDGTVVHFTGEPLERVAAEVRRTSYEDFARGGPVLRVQHADGLAPDETCERALRHLGARGYHVLFSNCEHFASWCATGRPHSGQVQRTAWHAAAAGWTLRAAAFVARRRLAGVVAARAAACIGPVGTTLAAAGLAVAAWNAYASRRRW